MFQTLSNIMKDKDWGLELHLAVALIIFTGIYLVDPSLKLTIIETAITIACIATVAWTLYWLMEKVKHIKF